MTEPKSASSSLRTLGLFSVLCIGINAIIGSGIYKLPGRLSYELGPASWLGFGLCALLLVAVALCFAEASGIFESTGGPYVYAREAFGTPVGFVVGWTAWVTMVTSWGAVANAIPAYLGRFFPALGAGLGAKLVVLAVIGGLGVVNYYGVRPGAFTTNFFTVAKIVPLAVFVLLGLAHLGAANLALVPAASSAAVASGARAGVGAALGAALFVALFPLQGFETAPVPAGETANPRRNVPIAVIGSLLGCALFYVLIQVVAQGTMPAIATSAASETPEAPWSPRPLADAASAFMGGWGASFLSLGACISMIGYCAGAALVTPRFLAAMAGDGLLPAPLTRRHTRFDSPHVAILSTTVVSLVAGMLLDFDKLVDFSNISVIMQYAGTCAAVTRLRYSRPEATRSYRVPGGAWLVPGVGIGICALLAWQATSKEFLFCAGSIAVGILLAVATRRLRRATVSAE
jgi:amino acid transporter